MTSNTPAVGRGSDLFERYTGRPAPTATAADRAVLAQMFTDLVHLAATVDGFDLDSPDCPGSVLAAGVRAAVGAQRAPETDTRIVRAPDAGSAPRARRDQVPAAESAPPTGLRTAIRGTLLTLAAEPDDDTYAPQVAQDAPCLPTRSVAPLRPARAG